MDRQDIMDWFRDDENIEDKLHSLSDCDKYEIALICLAHSDDLYSILDHSINLYVGNDGV